MPTHTAPLPNKRALTELLQQHLAGRGLMAHPLAGILGKGVLTQDELKYYCKIRYNAAPLFERLAERAHSLAAAQPGVQALTTALYRNLCDERGLDYDSGQATGEGSHGDWRRDCLDAIGVPITARGDFPLYAFDDSDDVWTITGMVLAAEYAIPLEYARLLKSMRHAFAETFTSADPAVPYTAEQFKATRYLQDHIEHDAARHMPELIQAILQDMRAPQDYARLMGGIERFAAERAALYDYIGKEFGYSCAA